MKITMSIKTNEAVIQGKTNLNSNVDPDGREITISIRKPPEPDTIGPEFWSSDLFDFRFFYY